MAVFVFMVILALGGFCYFVYWAATGDERARSAAQARVPEINAEHGLSFDTEHILVDKFPSDGFMVFDQQHRKLAICSHKDKTFCRIEDFSWLRGWSHTWQSNTYSQNNGFRTEVHTSTSHRIELQTADPNCPVLFFDVKSDYEASEWIARLNLLING